MYDHLLYIMYTYSDYILYVVKELIISSLFVYALIYCCRKSRLAKSSLLNRHLVQEDFKHLSEFLHLIVDKTFPTIIIIVQSRLLQSAGHYLHVCF